jgi:8-oxo-dGTP diphosphatase
MKDRKPKSRAPILAAGGIVLRGDRKPQVAIVQLRKLGAWVLPKGKLGASENAIAAARREVLEETGHRVSIHEFLGTLAYEAGGRPKVVQFWRMQALGGPVRELMRDVKAVQWLALEDAIAQLTHVREQVFLEHVGPLALKSAERAVRRTISSERPARKGTVERAPPSIRPDLVEPAALFASHGLEADLGAYFESPSEPPFETHSETRTATDLPADVAPIAGPDLSVPTEPASHDVEAPITESVTPAAQSGRTGSTAVAQAAAGRNMVEKTWVWFRQAALPNRQRRD